MPLTTVAPGLFSTFSRVSFLGVPMTARTTIASLSGGGLFVCSPGAIDDDLRREIDALGEVHAIVAPNAFHHLFVSAWRDAWPDASVYVPPSLVKKRPDLADVPVHGDEAPALYADEVAQIPIRGLALLDETWFFHRPTKTLIDTDVMHNVHEDPSWIARSGWKMMGAWKRFGPSRLERLLIRDRAALRESVHAALDWPFERVIVAHGDVFEPADVRDRVAATWRWLA
jgi:hypothetical protein